MSRNVFCLLVGIDEYQPPVPRLAGCCNDIATISAWLQGRVGKDDLVNLKLRVLMNDQATREAIINGFQQHLGQAGQDDVALFYFSGHGSQEQAPEEFWAIEPDHLNETLVCYDSRLPEGGHWDLADKELAQLIDDVAKKARHVVVVLDCCHSGSGTRDPRLAETIVRRVPIDRRQRPLDSYLITAGQAAQFAATRSVEDASGWYVAPEGKHVLLAACRDHQEAKEYYGGGQSRGAFSYFLTETLAQCGERVTYRDLFGRVASLISAHVTDQSPQLESVEQSALDGVFLDGTIQPAPASYAANFRDGAWTINAGRVHGLHIGDEDEQLRFALFSFAASVENLAVLANSVATARAVDVGPTTTRIELVDATVMDQSATYKAVVTEFPVPRLPVRLEGDDAVLKSIRQSLATASSSGGASLFVCETTDAQCPEFRVLARNNEIIITRPENDRPLVEQIKATDSDAGPRTVARLEHISRWVQTARLHNTGTSLRSDAVTVQILRNGQPISDPIVRLEYEQRDGQWQPPKFQIKLKNNSDRPLFCGLLDLTETFKISADGLMSSGCIRLEADQEAWAFNGRAIPARIPDQIWRRGVTEYRDILKLIVCTGEFDVRDLAQDALDLPRHVERSGTRGLTRNSTLNRLMRRVQTRDFGGDDSTAEEIDDWTASQLTFVTVRPLDATPLRDSGTATLSGGVRINGHPQFRANARLATVPAASRDTGNLAVPPLMRDHPDVCRPFTLVPTRASEPGLSVLELSNVENHTAVTPNEPLKLTVPSILSDEEHALPVGFDGEFFLPLGFAHRQPDGNTELVLERLPDPTSHGRRSLTGSIRIFFQKLISEKLGLPYEHPILAAVTDVSATGRVSYDGDLNSVKQRVAKANRILILTHGIIGDTRVMAACTRFADDSSRRLVDNYDVILTFDYENLNTPIPEIARQLKQRLEAVGLGPNHGKRLDLVAHSMGGLVSRWFIEREGGSQIVERLVMLGTPNGGSPWPTIQDWATAALTLGINAGWFGASWPVSWLGALGAAVERIDVTLDQMAPGSDFLGELAASPDPGIPYWLIAGNTSLIATPSASDADWWQRLWSRLTFKNVLHGVTAPAFFGQPNDIAVSVNSVSKLPSCQDVSMKIAEVPADHLSYFTEDSALAVLRRRLEA